MNEENKNDCKKDYRNKPKLYTTVDRTGDFYVGKTLPVPYYAGDGNPK